MRATALPLAVLAACLTACNGGGQTCIEVNTDCDPLYEPTYENVFTRTLEPSCAVDGPCHNAASAQGGLVYEDPDEAYDLLLGVDGEARVVPGDPGCSLLVRRLESDNPGFRMPPGQTPLPAEERCSVIQWIADGAER